MATRMERLRILARKLVPTPWQHPVINTALRALDPIDGFARVLNNRSRLPKYSVRVHSYGMRRQFGGRSFDLSGHVHTRMLVNYAELVPEARVLELGCGCGRVAIKLAEIVSDSKYVGMDVDKITLHACRHNPFLTKKGFQFIWMDVHNGRYNPGGKISPAEYKFPFASSSFDIVFLVAVFSYMLPADVRNYIAEISRVLAPGGICMMSTYLMDYNDIGKPSGLVFPYTKDECWYANKNLPEALVGYYLSFFQEEFKQHDMAPVREPMIGWWRHNPAVQPESKVAQDFLFFRRGAKDTGA